MHSGGAEGTLELVAYRGRDRSDMSFTNPESRAADGIRLYIVHEQPMIAESLAIALQQADDIEIVGLQTTTDHLERRLIVSSTNVLLLDAAIEPARLAEIIRAIRDTARVIIIARDPDATLMLRGLRLGVAGFLVGPRALTELATAIRRAHERWLVLTHEQLMELLTRSHSRETNPYAAALCERLSERECTVLQVLSTGASTEEVARRLLISTHTVHSHIKNAMRKLNVRSKLMAVVLAFAAGIVDGPDGAQTTGGDDR